MESSKYSLEDEKLCRLCGEIQKNVVQLYGDGREDFLSLIRRTLGFLNIEFNENDLLPNWICAACHLDAEATEKFLTMVAEGQSKLRQRIKECDGGTGITIAQNEKNEDNGKLRTDNVEHNKKSARNLRSAKKAAKKSKSKGIKFVEEMQSETETAEPNKFHKYPRRKRKKVKRFPCDPTPYIETAEEFGGADLDAESKEDDPAGDAVSGAGTLIIKPIAEFCAANGTALGEIIAVDAIDERQHQQISNAPVIRLVCEYCKEVFTTQHLFLKHLRIHNEPMFACVECEASYQTLSELRKHEKLKRHRGTTIVAKQATKNDKEEQKSNESNDTLINIVIDDDEQITAMDREAANEVTPQCVPKETAEVAAQIEKSDVKNRKTTYKCLKCNKLYSTHYSVMRHHQQVHIGARTYKCQHCSASFKNGCNLTYHMAKHTGIRKNKCDKCDKAFVHKSELTLHLRSHTGDKPYKCEHCSKSFSHRSNMVTHMRLHSGKLPFRCETCGLNFNSSSHFKRHKQMHLRHAQKAIELRLNEAAAEGKEKLQTSSINISTAMPCNVAEQSTNAPTTSLLRPKQTIVKSVEILPPIDALPPGPEPRIDSSDLKKLILKNLHTEQRDPPAPLRFQCAQCLQRFKLKSTLTKHLRTHTGEKPYRCPFCPRAFADPSNFKRHKSLHKNATEQLKNVSIQLKSTASSNLLSELQRDRGKNQSKSLPVAVSASPAHSIASDPDPDGLEAIRRTSALELSDDGSGVDDDNNSTILAMLDDVAEQSLKQITAACTTSATNPSTSVSLLKSLPKSPRLVCISYPNPSNPSDNKMTTFYV